MTCACMRCKAEEPGAFLNDGTKIKPRQIHPFYDQPEEDQPSPFPPSERNADESTGGGQ